MFSQERLIAEVDADFARLFEKNESSFYERFCGNLSLKDLFCTDSVYICAKRCSSGFMNKKDTQFFMRRPWNNAAILCNQVLEGRFIPKYYSTRTIVERGKARIIKPPTFDCKVVQKVICDYLIRPLLEPRMVSTNYASVRNRGTAKMYEDICLALNRAVEKSRKDPRIKFEVILFDYRNYFGSIPIALLMKKLGRLIKDERLLSLIQMFSAEEYGLSLGNELSQIPASWYPSGIDHFFKDRLRIPEFRYMDDTLIIVPVKLGNEYIRQYRKQSAEIGLSCPEEKIHVFPLKESFAFCKEKFIWNRERSRYDRMINPKRVGNEERKLNAFARLRAEGSITEETIRQQSQGVIGSIESHPHTHKNVRQLRKLQGKALKIR